MTKKILIERYAEIIIAMANYEIEEMSQEGSLTDSEKDLQCRFIHLRDKIVMFEGKRLSLDVDDSVTLRQLISISLGDASELILKDEDRIKAKELLKLIIK